MTVRDFDSDVGDDMPRLHVFGMPVLPDDGLRERILDGELDPIDAPPGFSHLADLLNRVDAERGLAQPEPDLELVAAMALTVHGPGGDHVAPSAPKKEKSMLGKIISINLPDIMLENNDKTEKNILTDDDTSVRRFRERISVSDLKVGDLVVVIGSPDDKGQIQARLIRLIPTPAAALSTTTQIQQ